MLIVLEGADGVGKTTHANRLAERLTQATGQPVVRLSEPTDGPYGRRIREAARSGQRPNPREEARWFTEDRREDVARNIGPALAAGRVVVLDRYFYSTAAYQGVAGVPREEILVENRAFAPEPDLCLMLTAPVEVAQQRITAGRGDAPDAFEEGDYQRRVAEAFREIAAALIAEGRCPMVVVDTSGSIDEVDEAIWRAVQERLPQLFA